MNIFYSRFLLIIWNNNSNWTTNYVSIFTIALTANTTITTIISRAIRTIGVCSITCIMMATVILLIVVIVITIVVTTLMIA
jgi:hypothetical protein